MSAAYALTLVPSAIAIIVAVTVPWFTFRLALKQDRLRRLHDQRAQLYVDLLTEAHAEKEYFDYDIADDETRERMRAYRVDIRLPPLERARLGSRGTIFASRTVNRLFNQLQGRALDATLTGRPKDEGERIAARMPPPTPTAFERWLCRRSVMRCRAFDRFRLGRALRRGVEAAPNAIARQLRHASRRRGAR